MPTTTTTATRTSSVGDDNTVMTQLPPPIDFSSYPPCLVAWTYTAIDTVCDYTSSLSSSSSSSSFPYLRYLDCSNWRDTLPSSWTTTSAASSSSSSAAAVDPWFSLSNKYPTPIIDLLPPLSTYDDFLATTTTTPTPNPQVPSKATIASTVSSLYEFAQTPSTTLADLTSGSSLLALVGLVWIMRRIKATVIPFFSQLGRNAAFHTHGANWCTDPTNQIRITKFGEYVFRLCFHSMISITGMVLFWNTPWWSDVVHTNNATATGTILVAADNGGSTTNDIATTVMVSGTPTLFLDFPHQPIEPSMIWYYLIQAAYNVEAMVCLLELSFDIRFQSPFRKSNTTTTQKDDDDNKTNNKSSGDSMQSTSFQSPIHIGWSTTVRGDFREMFIHHVITNLLIFGSSFIRMTRVGSMVFLVHDISDVPVDLSKLANFLKWKTTTVVCFVSMVLVWLATRLYILPFVIFRSVITESWLVCANGYIHPIYWVLYRPIFIGLMGLLILLHLIWFSMFIRMGYVLVSKGEAHDLSEHKKGEHQQHQQNGHATMTNGQTATVTMNGRNTKTSPETKMNGTT